MLKTDQEKTAHAELIQRVANLEYRLPIDLVTAAVDAIERSDGLITQGMFWRTTLGADSVPAAFKNT